MHNEIFAYIQAYLGDRDSYAAKIGYLPFRKRSEHINRVYVWAKRLLVEENIQNADEESILIAALFHDVGYAVALDGTNHAQASAEIFEKYATEHGYDEKKKEFISYLVRNHSSKELMTHSDTPIELIILMEADLLDESGALSIVWDCMHEGGQESPTFAQSYDHICAYSGKILKKFPMVTPWAESVWTRKQALVREFIAQLECDIEEDLR